MSELRTGGKVYPATDIDAREDVPARVYVGAQHAVILSTRAGIESLGMRLLAAAHDPKLRPGAQPIFVLLNGRLSDGEIDELRDRGLDLDEMFANIDEDMKTKGVQ